MVIEATGQRDAPVGLVNGYLHRRRHGFGFRVERLQRRHGRQMARGVVLAVLCGAALRGTWLLKEQFGRQRALGTRVVMLGVISLRLACTHAESLRSPQQL